MILKKKELGAKGEEVAVRYLKKRGYRIVERNYRIKLGEIDIIAEQGDNLVSSQLPGKNRNSFQKLLLNILAKKIFIIGRHVLMWSVYNFKRAAGVFGTPPSSCCRMHLIFAMTIKK